MGFHRGQQEFVCLGNPGALILLRLTRDAARQERTQRQDQPWDASSFSKHWSVLLCHGTGGFHAPNDTAQWLRDFWSPKLQFNLVLTNAQNSKFVPQPRNPLEPFVMLRFETNAIML